MPLLTRWHLIHDNNLQADILLTKIVKKRISKGIKSYEIKWNNYEMTTIEPLTAVQLRYSKEVLMYEDIHSKSSNKKTKSNLYLFYYIFVGRFSYIYVHWFFSVTIGDSKLVDVTNKLSLMTISNKNAKSRKNNEVKDKNTFKGPLDKFITKEKTKDDSLTLSDFECDSVDLDLSGIINEIIVS